MFSHIFVGADDIDQAKAFYDATLGALGVEPGVIDPKGRIFYRTEDGVFGITLPLDGEAATGANGGTIGFTRLQALKQPMPGTRPGSRLGERPAKTHRACERAAASISLTCAIPPATSALHLS